MKLEKRLARDNSGINSLDTACEENDIAYSLNSEDVAARNEAECILAKKAWERVTAKDSKIGEKLTAMGVAGIMKVKSKMGMGLKKKTSFRKIVTAAKTSMKVDKDAKKVIKSALRGARKALRKTGGKKNVNEPKVIPIVEGGALPLIPIFAGLSALGSLTGGVAGIVKAINDAQAAKQQIYGEKRHNNRMEIGKGLYLRPYKSGSGLCLYKDLKKKSRMF